MFWLFGHKACEILAPRPGIEPAPPALGGEVLTTGPPGTSQSFLEFRFQPIPRENEVENLEVAEFKS